MFHGGDQFPQAAKGRASNLQHENTLPESKNRTNQGIEYVLVKYGMEQQQELFIHPVQENFTRSRLIYRRIFNADNVRPNQFRQRGWKIESSTSFTFSASYQHRYFYHIDGIKLGFAAETESCSIFRGKRLWLWMMMICQEMMSSMKVWCHSEATCFHGILFTNSKHWVCKSELYGQPTHQVWQMRTASHSARICIRARMALFVLTLLLSGFAKNPLSYGDIKYRNSRNSSTICLTFQRFQKDGVSINSYRFHSSIVLLSLPDIWKPTRKLPSNLKTCIWWKRIAHGLCYKIAPILSDMNQIWMSQSKTITSKDWRDSAFATNECERDVVS